MFPTIISFWENENGNRITVWQLNEGGYNYRLESRNGTSKTIEKPYDEIKLSLQQRGYKEEDGVSESAQPAKDFQNFDAWLNAIGSNYPNQITVNKSGPTHYVATRENGYLIGTFDPTRNKGWLEMPTLTNETNFPYNDHMPGAVRHDLSKKMKDDVCKACSDREFVYKTPDGKMHPNKISKEAKQIKCRICGGETVNAKTLQKLLYSEGFTYPINILTRRLKFLTHSQLLRIRNLMIKAQDLSDEDRRLTAIETIDNIIAKEAEKRNDPWK